MLRAILAEVVWVISHPKDNALSAQYHRLARRIGKNKAVMAVAHSVLMIMYHVLHTEEPYSALVADYFQKLDTTRLTQRSVRQLEALGYEVTLTPNAASPLWERLIFIGNSGKPSRSYGYSSRVRDTLASFILAKTAMHGIAQDASERTNRIQL